MRFRLVFISRMGMGIGSLFDFQFSSMGLAADDLGSNYYNYELYFVVFFSQAVVIVVFDDFPKVLEELKSYAATTFANYYY